MSTTATEKTWSTMWHSTLEKLGLVSVDATTNHRCRIRRLEVMPSMVSAEVQDQKRGLCQVTLTFTPLTEQAWLQLQDILQQQILSTLQLDPRSIFAVHEPIFPQIRTLLLPTDSDDIQVSCSCCQAKLEYCPAILAIYHQVGEMLDEEPVLLLRLRGYEWQALVQELQQRRTVGYSTTTAPGDLHGKKAEHEESETLSNVVAEVVVLPTKASEFWGSRRALETFHHHISPPSIDLTILRRLGPLPDILSDPTVDQQLAALYRHVTREAETFAYDLDMDNLDADNAA